ncbi:MAG: ABC transporter substrate-binding protein [Sphaerochaeta sp.]
MPPFPPQGAGYLTLLSRHSLGNGTMVMLVLLSLRWGIKFQPTNPPDYNATLRLQLDSKTGPDLMYARSYAAGQELFNAGYFADCSDITGLKENFSASNRAPWQMPDGTQFAVPFASVSHAVYYNKDIFEKEGLTRRWPMWPSTVLRVLKR